MSTIVKIKRSPTALAPALGILQEGELAYSQDRTGNGSLAKLYIHSKSSTGTEVVHEIGGKYFTDAINSATDLATANTIVKRDATGSASFVNLNITGDLTVTGNTDYVGNTNYTGDVIFEGDISVNGGDIKSSASTFNFLPANVTTLNIGSMGTTSNFLGNVAIGGSITVAQSATVSADFTANTATITGDLLVNGNTVLGDAPTDTTTINGLTTVITPTTLAAASSTLDAFLIRTIDNQPIFQVKQNGDTVIAGVLSVLGDGTSYFAGNVSIGGSITVAEGATVTADFTANTATITGDLMVNGSSFLGDNAAVDTTTIKGLTSVQTSRTKAAAEADFVANGANALKDAFRVVDSTGASLFQVKDNGDTVIAGVLTVNGTGTSTFAGDVSIGGSITVAEGSTVTADFSANDAVITGNLYVNGNTFLGDNPADNVSVIGVAAFAETATFAKGVVINGDLTVNGTTTTVNSETLVVEDPLIKLASGNTSDSLDIGFYGQYNEGAVVKYSGLFRDAGSTTFRLFTGLEVEPTTSVNTAGAGFTVGTLFANLTGGVVSGLASAISVADGGTGRSSFTSKGIVYGNGTNPLEVTAEGAAGTVLQAGSDGTPIFAHIDGGTY